MSDDFSDWGYAEATAAPSSSAAPADNSFADWGYAETAEKKKADEAAGMSWTDTVKNVAAGGLGDVAALATTGQVVAERAGYPTIAKYAQEASTGLHDLEQQVDESISPAARKSRDAVLFKSDDEQERLGARPGRQAAMKLSGVVAPAAVGYAGGVLGGIIGSAIGPEGTAAGAAAGTALAGAGYGLAKGIDQAVAWTNKLTDEELEKEAPVFGQFKKMYLEQGMTPEKASYEARVGLHEGLYGIGQAAFDAGTNALAFGAGRKVIAGAFGEKALVDYALTGGSLGAASASGDVNTQNIENVKKGTNAYDLSRTAIAFLNGTAEGLAFHGMSERGRALVNWMKPKSAATGEAPPAPATEQTTAPSTGAAPKTTRADTQPPPNEAAQEGQIGNTVNPPTRDQGVGAKGEAARKVGKKRGTAPEVEGSVTTADISPEQIQALANSTEAGGSDVVKLAETAPQQPDVTQIISPEPRPAPAEVTATATDADVAGVISPEPAKSDNIPEAPPTIDAQIEMFNKGTTKFVRFEDADQVPDAENVPAGVQEHEAPDGSIWWYKAAKPRAAIEKKINAAIEKKTENELLPHLGPFNKEAVAQDVAAGAEPTAVVARTPEGVELAAAASTDRLAPDTIEAMQDAHPDATVGMEQPQGVIEGRLNGTGKPLRGDELRQKVETLASEATDAFGEGDSELGHALQKSSGMLPGREIEGVGTPQERESTFDVIDVLVDRGRADAAEALVSRWEQYAERPVAEPGVSKDSPKYETIKADLERRKQDDQALASEARRRLDEAVARQDAKPETKLEAPREPRVFDVTTPEQRAAADRAQAELDAKRAEENKRAAAIERGLEEKPEVVQGERRSKDTKRVAAAAENAKKAQAAFEAHVPTEIESALTREGATPQEKAAAKAAMVERYRRAVEMATAAGYEIPKAIRNHTAAEKFIKQAASLVRAYGKSKAEKLGDKVFVEFQISEKLQRGSAEDFKVDLQKTRGDNDLKFQKKTSDRPVETTEEVGSVTGAKVDSKSETRVVKDKEGNPIKVEAQQAASPVRRVQLSDAEKKALAEKYSQPQSRSFEDDDFDSAFHAYEKANRETGEREGHVSYGYNSTAASAPIGRTAKVRDVFAREVLQHTKTKGLFGTLFRSMRGKLVDVVGDVQVHFISAEDMAAIHKDGARAKGFYKEKANGEGGYIVMVEGLSKEKMAHVFTHEALHAATSDALSSSERLTKQVRSIMDEVKRAIPEIEKTYGFKDEHEFIAEAFSNAEFQDQLARTKVSPELAKALGMPEARGQSVWRAMVRAIQKALGFEPGSMSALEAVLRPTSEAMERYGVEGRGEQHSLTAREQRDNIVVGAKKALRAVSTTTMIAQRAARLGSRFGEYARRADDVYRRMAAYRDEHLQKFGGDELIRRGDDLRTRKPTALADGTAIADRANILRVDPTKDDAWHEKFFGKDKTKWWQAKSKIKDIRKDWADFKAREPEVAKFIEDGARWGSKALERQTEQRVSDYLEAADLYDPALASRILKAGKVPDTDRHLFSSDIFIDHIDRVVAEGKHAGWYFHLTRDGDYVVTARREFDVPTGSHVARVGTDRVVFADPSGKGGNLAARRAAEAFVKNHSAKKIAGEADYLPHNDTNKIWVDKNDITKELDKSDVDAIPAYRVTLQDRFMSKYKTAGEARTAFEELKTAGWVDVRNPEVSRLSPFARLGGIVPSQVETMLNSMRNRDKFKNLEPAQKAEMIAAMHQSTIKMLPGMRFQQTRLQRQNVAGYSKDIVESLGRSIQMDAGYSARMKFATKLKDAVDDMRDYISSRNDKFNLERSEIVRDLEDRYYAGQEFRAPGMLDKAISFSNRLSMVTKLAGPSQPLMSASEVGVVAVPVLARGHGLVKAVRAVKDAYKAIGVANVSLAGVVDTARAATQNSGFTSYRDLIQQNILNSGIESGKAFRYVDLIDHLHDVNLLNREAGMEVQRLMQDRPSNPIAKLIDRTDLMFRQVNQAIEAINRSVTGIAAYELAYSKNKNHFSALRAAQDAVHDTMGDYSADNAAPIFNSMFGKTALQFKKYGQKTYGLVGKLLGDSLRGDRDAQLAFMGVMLTHGLAAGALGLPGMEVIKAATAVTGVLGGPSYDDFQMWARERLENLFGKTGGEAIARGVPRVAGVDLAGRMSSDSFILPMDNPRSVKTGDMMEWIGSFVAGAPGSLPSQIGGAVKALLDQDPGKFVEAGPFKAARDIYRAVHGAQSGFQDSTGRTKNTALSPSEAIVQGLGFTPGRIAEERERQRSDYTRTKERDTERRTLMNKWISATDDAGKRSAVEAIQSFNKGKPKDAQISWKDLTTQAKRRRTEEAKGTYVKGMRVTKRNRDIVERALETYGD